MNDNFNFLNKTINYFICSLSYDLSNTVHYRSELHVQRVAELSSVEPSASAACASSCRWRSAAAAAAAARSARAAAAAARPRLGSRRQRTLQVRLENATRRDCLPISRRRTARRRRADGAHSAHFRSLIDTILLIITVYSILSPIVTSNINLFQIPMRFQVPSSGALLPPTHFDLESSSHSRRVGSRALRSDLLTTGHRLGGPVPASTSIAFFVIHV